MNPIAKAACERLDAVEPFVLATIISHTDSTPRTSGSQMIVTADGRGIGTIGGGLLEAGTMSRAVELIRAGQSAIVPFDLSYETVDTMDMICGGRAEVLLACIRPTLAAVAVFHRWRCMLDDRKPGWLLTVVTGSAEDVKQVDHCLVTEAGEMVGGLPLPEKEQERVLAAAAETKAMRTIGTDNGFVLVEPARRAATVHLFGAGHVALSTGALAAMAGFRVAVADDREEFANPERFPDAREIRVLENFGQAFSGLAAGKDDYVVILTRGHLHDKTVLAQALKTEAGYIGMIGSRKKRDAIYRALEKEGVAQADIDRVHSPIGLAIGAETPEEIAVSIMAELIAVRAGIA